MGCSDGVVGHLSELPKGGGPQLCTHNLCFTQKKHNDYQILQL